MIDSTAALCLFAAIVVAIAYALRTPSRKISRAMPGGARETFLQAPAQKGNHPNEHRSREQRHSGHAPH